MQWYEEVLEEVICKKTEKTYITWSRVVGDWGAF